MNKNLNAHFYVLLATFLIGGSFIASQKLAGNIDPISITLLRFVIASVFLAPFVFLKKEFRLRIVPTFRRAMIISFFYALFFIGMFKALEYSSALNTGTIFTLLPLLTAIFTFFVFKQVIYLKQYLVYFIGILGTLIVVFKGDINSFLEISLNKGDIIFLFSIISMSLYSISAKYFYKKDDKLIVLVFMTLLGGSLWMLLALLILDIPLQWSKIDNTLYIYMIYLSIIATLITSFLYQKANIILGPKIVMSYVYLNPAVISILLFLLEGKTMNFWTTLGILISSFSTIVLLNSNKIRIEL
ncbi:MAG: DMT family transporter [Campylobacteraceae bacterium]|nr:DMT family transporter [Campylobacteraceae bacterium]